MKDILIEEDPAFGDGLNPAHADIYNDTVQIYGPCFWFEFDDFDWIPEAMVGILAHEQTHLTLHHLLVKDEPSVWIRRRGYRIPDLKKEKQRTWAKLDNVCTARYTGRPENEINLDADPSGFAKSFIVRLEKNP